MKKTKVCALLGIEHPLLQAGFPWASNPELVAAVSNAGGLGILHPTAGMSRDGELVHNLRQNIRQVKRLTSAPFGVSFYLGNPQVPNLIEAAAQEGVTIVVTYGGSPTLYTGTLKGEGVKVLHQVGTVRHARGAEAQGVDMVIAQGADGGGVMGQDGLPTLVLVPQVVDALSIPVIASGGIMDSRGAAAALALGAQGVQMGTRFAATHECIAHSKYKEALVGAIDTGTLVLGWPHRPTRVLRTERALKLRDDLTAYSDSGTAAQRWEAELGPEQARAAMLEGDLENSVCYCGAGVGLISDILPAEEVVRVVVEGISSVARGIQ